ncbi:MAG TPA: hypothetical protein VNN77_10900 [candidate division Zixibacteria bacterium]|nr:hypothetical protein [candidate division Zixibacteria bacterium]
MISLDQSIIYQILLFLLLWVVLSRLLFRPYLHVLEERERRTSGTEQEANRLAGEAARLKGEYEERIAQAQAAGAAARDAVVQEGREQRERIIAEARREAAATLERIRRELHEQMQRERAIAAAEADLVAREMASKVLGRRVG